MVSRLVRLYVYMCIAEIRHRVTDTAPAAMQYSCVLMYAFKFNLLEGEIFRHMEMES